MVAKSERIAKRTMPVATPASTNTDPIENPTDRARDGMAIDSAASTPGSTKARQALIATLAAMASHTTGAQAKTNKTTLGRPTPAARRGGAFGGSFAERAAVALTVRNVELHEELQSRLDDLEAARRRLVEAVDRQRAATAARLRILAPFDGIAGIQMAERIFDRSRTVRGAARSTEPGGAAATPDGRHGVQAAAATFGRARAGAGS